jgi:hypothetical protein
MKVTTITAKKAVQKKMVFIDFSFSREYRACPADGARALRCPVKDFTIIPSKNLFGFLLFHPFS